MDADYPNNGVNFACLSTGDDPSEKQLAFAEKIATAMKCGIPDDARASRTVLTSWIEKHKDKLPAPAAKPPSEKKIQFAEKIASEASVELPTAVRENSFQLSKWIDKNMKKGGKRKSSPKRKR